jgi:hypothetical protein
VRLVALDVGDEADAAGIVLVLGAVQAVLGRLLQFSGVSGRCPTLVGLGHGVLRPEIWNGPKNTAAQHTLQSN